MDALQIANSFPMWIACGVAVVLVIVQALIFIKKAIDAAPEVGVTKENALDIILQETGKVFAAVLEDAGVYKNTETGKAAFLKFAEAVNQLA